MKPTDCAASGEDTQPEEAPSQVNAKPKNSSRPIPASDCQPPS